LDGTREIEINILEKIDSTPMVVPTNVRDFSLFGNFANPEAILQKNNTKYSYSFPSFDSNYTLKNKSCKHLDC
jgi:hypothetical protein